jgi:LytS/YehU family sensor histidine kinase
VAGDGLAIEAGVGMAVAVTAGLVAGPVVGNVPGLPAGSITGLLAGLVTVLVGGVVDGVCCMTTVDPLTSFAAAWTSWASASNVSTSARASTNEQAANVSMYR